jgi:hypothetical protein
MIWWAPKWVRFKRSNLAGELDHGEHLWASAYANYQTAWPWVRIIGRLFLTDQVLEFRASPGQGSVEILVMPLRTIRGARAICVFMVSNDLRVERCDGSFEVFHFSAFSNSAREWAQAIMEFRDDLEEAD